MKAAESGPPKPALALAREAGDVEVGGADPQAHVPALAQPVGAADVVGVHVGDDHAQHRQAVEHGGEDLLPGGAGRRVVDAAVDDGPALADAPSSSSSSRSSQRLMWSSANGRPMRSQRTPGATSIVVARRRQGLAEGVGELAFERIHRRPFTLYVNVNSECIRHARCCRRASYRAAVRGAARADLHHRRAGARVRPHHPGDPLLRGLRPARAGAQPAATASTAPATAPACA